MTTASEKMIQAIEYIVKPISIGTNLALLHLLWAMVSGKFLLSRGAVHTALALSGLSDGAIRRGGTALRQGQWTIEELTQRWREWVLNEEGWTIRHHEGWRAVSCDIVVFPRLKLAGWFGHCYRGLFGRAVKAIGVGIIVDVGHYNGERVPLLHHIVRCKNEKKCEPQLQSQLLKACNMRLGNEGVLVHDAGTSVKELRQIGVKRFVIRMANNCVVRRNQLPTNAHGNRQYGQLIRPVERTRQGETIASTDDANMLTSFVHQERTITVKGWLNVVLKTDKLSGQVASFNLWVFLTRYLTNPSSWRLTWPKQMHRPRLFSSSILTAGQLSNCHWRRNRWWGYIASLFSISTVVSDYPNWHYWQVIC